MPTRIEIKCSPDPDIGSEIRILFCRQSGKKPDDKNPLMETNFNELLDKLAQAAFDEGRQFEQKHPRI